MKKLSVNLRLAERLPIVGILAFSLCSVHSIDQFLQGQAAHPTPLYTIAACLIELATAWLVFQTVETVRKVTRSNISKQDRRFYSLVLGAFLLLTAPSLSASIVANVAEFGDLLLGALFPLLSVACAIGAALPETVQKHEKQRKAETESAKAETERKRLEKERKQLEAERKRLETERQQAATQAETERKAVETLLASLGRAAETLRQYLETPEATQADVAGMLGTSERTVRNHLRKLERAGVVKRDGQGVELLIDLPDGWGNGYGGNT